MRPFGRDDGAPLADVMFEKRRLWRKEILGASICIILMCVAWMRPRAFIACPATVSESARLTPPALYDILPDFAFHVYPLPPSLLDDLVNSSNPEGLPVHPLLNWRDDNMQVMTPYFITKFLPLHPRHTKDPEKADIFIIPHVSPMAMLVENPHHAEYRERLKTYLATNYNHYIRRRRGSDHYVFDFTVGSQYGSIFPDIHKMTYELLPHTLPVREWSRSSDTIIMPFVEMTPRLEQRQQAAIRLGDDDAFLASEPPRTLFAFYSGSSTGPSGRLRPRIIESMSVYNDTVPYYLSNRHSADKYDVISDMMMRSVFCPAPSGDSPSARRQITAVMAGCIPVIMSDFILHPFGGIVDWTRFSIQLPTRILAYENFIDRLRLVPQERIREMQKALLAAARRFTYHFGAPKKGDVLDTLVERLALHAYKIRAMDNWMIFSNGTEFHELKETGGKAINFYPNNVV